MAQPDWEQIERELRDWHRLRDEGVGSAALERAAFRSPLLFWAAMPLRTAQFLVHDGARRAGANRLRILAARSRLWTDSLTLMPGASALHAVYTDLGLALLERGDVEGATDCLRRAWHVHPCPRSVTFGLRTELWSALAPYPEAAAARLEYEKVARRFSPSFRPSPSRPLPEVPAALWRHLREVVKFAVHMPTKVPHTRQPTWNEVLRQLDEHAQWWAAVKRSGRQPPPKYVVEAKPEWVVNAWMPVGAAVYALRVAGRRTGWRSVRKWAAVLRIEIDRYNYEPAACGLNQAYTELGLVLLERGEVEGALECLRRSAHVSPCPHDTSFGLDPRLWRALATVPEAEAPRARYAHLARRFSPSFDRPQKRLPLRELVRQIVRAYRTRDERPPV